MRALAAAAVIGSVIAVAAAVARRSVIETWRANIRRYSMPGPASYDRVAHLLFRSRYRAIAAAIAAEVPAGSRLLDVGCGPGEILVELATLAPAIETTGLDVDAAMVARAELKAGHAARRGTTRRPAVVVADVGSMPFADASFDVVVSSFAVHHWPDRQAGLAEVMRVLRPGGRATIWDIAPPHPTDDPETATRSAHGHAPANGGHSPEAPSPSLVRTLRMLTLFRRMPFERYDFTKPEG